MAFATFSDSRAPAINASIVERVNPVSRPKSAFVSFLIRFCFTTSALKSSKILKHLRILFENSHKIHAFSVKNT
nr:MAG TPA: hypothetical protein [Caudoviricetes sp.]